MLKCGYLYRFQLKSEKEKFEKLHNTILRMNVILERMLSAKGDDEYYDLHGRLIFRYRMMNMK